MYTHAAPPSWRHALALVRLPLLLMRACMQDASNSCCVRPAPPPLHGIPLVKLPDAALDNATSGVPRRSCASEL